MGLNWDRYKQDLEKYGEQAAEVRFQEQMILPSNSIDDPLPIDKALKLYKQIILKS